MTYIENIIKLIEGGNSFVLEAGAGSGKTFTLIQTLNYLLQEHGKKFQFQNKKIICITYTNVAKNEIVERLENNPLVEVSTIHDFFWEKIKAFQKQLLIELDILNEEMASSKPDKFTPGLLQRGLIKEVVYNDTSFRDFEHGLIHHDDVLQLAAIMFSKYKLLTSIVAEKHPFIFIDEYQDTAEEVVSALVNSLQQREQGKTVLGFYGDSYQKIYDNGVGTLDNYVALGKLSLVTKDENYRSSKNVVFLLNKIRSNIQQIIPEDSPNLEGSIMFINCNNYPAKEKKQKITEYEKAIIPIKNKNYQTVIEFLTKKGWDFGENSKDKVLILANSRVAERGNFGELYRVFANRYGDKATDALMKRENIFVRFFLGSVDKKTSKERKSGIEHLLWYWDNKDYNSIMAFLNQYGQISWDFENTNTDHFFLRNHCDKTLLHSKLSKLSEISNKGKISEVFEFVISNKIVSIPENLSKFLKRMQEDPSEIENIEEREKLEKDQIFYNGLMSLPYIQLRNSFKHTQNQTPFSTKHGTKGDEFRNVLVVIDDTSWKQKYNFENFIDDSEEKDDRKLRTRNLFYVSCSRAKENLVVLSLSEMNTQALTVISNWFKPTNVFSICNLP